MYTRTLLKFKFPKITSSGCGCSNMVNNSYKNFNKRPKIPSSLRLCFIAILIISLSILGYFAIIKIHQQSQNCEISTNSRTIPRPQQQMDEFPSPIFQQDLYHLDHTPIQAILLRVKGGMGNQLFQYACSYALARKLGWPLYIHHDHTHTHSHSHNASLPTSNKRPFALDAFNIPLHSWNVVNEDWISNRSQDIQEIQDSQLLGPELKFKESPPGHPPSRSKILTLSSKDYCQSETFFSSYIPEIRGLFQVKGHSDQESSSSSFFQDWATLIRASGGNSIAVHIRRGDFLQLGRAVPFSFYRDGISHFLHHLNRTNSTFFIFSDQILTPKVKSLLAKGQAPLGKRLHFVEGLGPLQDFNLMTQCSHALIGNSSFGWWGAYLIRNRDKVVIVASYDLTTIWSSYFRWQYKYLYYPANWKKINVNYEDKVDEEEEDL